MSGLEQALIRLRAEIDFPPTPAAAAAVERRLAEGAPRPRRGPGTRRTLALALAVLAVALAGALAVSPARSAILEWLGLRGATVERVERLPEVPAGVGRSLELGRPVPLEGGVPRLDFPLLVPDALGPPDAAFFSAEPPGGMVSLVYDPGDGVPRSRFTGVGAVVSQFHGDVTPALVAKLVDQATVVEPVDVEGRRGLWIEGEHVLLFRSPDGRILEERARLAGNTLLVEHGRLLVRLEGEFTRERALEIAASLRPVHPR
ncbi:MAG TPA: hypothetical protein VHF23_01470 [Gaiellaceae bacterium]|nr:hypothetical protein [Gaiellaceae bacterium]